MREEIVRDLLQLSENPYGRYRQAYMINGHVIDFSYSDKMMYAVTVDRCYRQVNPRLLGKKIVVDCDGEELTEIQYILKSLDLDYVDIDK